MDLHARGRRGEDGVKFLDIERKITSVVDSQPSHYIRKHAPG